MSGDTLVLARALGGRLLAKQHTRQPDGSFATSAYDNAYWISIREVPVNGPLELARALEEACSDPRVCVLRGNPLPGINRSRCRRLYLPHREEDGSITPPSFEPAARHALGVDFDALPCPQWNPDDLARRRVAIERNRNNLPHAGGLPKGADDGEDYDLAADGDPAPVDPVRDWGIITRWAISTLPAEFHDAHCWCQLTSSAGLAPGIRIRLWFWCDRAVSDAECKRWLAASPVDRSLYNPVQPHYIARPIFDPPDADPVARRSWFWWRHVAAVPVPELPEPPPPPPIEPVERIVPTVTGDHREIARQCLARADLSGWEREFCSKVAGLDKLTQKQSETLAGVADPLPARAERYADAALRAVATATKGERHPTLMAVAVRLYSLANEGLLDPGHTTRRLLAAGEMPLDAAERHERTSGGPGSNEQALDWARARAVEAPDLPEGFPPMTVALDIPAARELREQEQQQRPNGQAAPRALDLIWADDIEPAIDQAGLVEGLLGTTGLTVAYGESGCGKTFVIVDLSCHVAARMPWRGLDVAAGVVVYVAAEGPKSVERRVWAWMKHHDLEHLPLVVVRSSVDLLHGDAKAILAALMDIRAKHGRIALVVIDTLARAMIGNENSPEDMGAFVAACASIRETAETHVLIVHHCGKEAARGARGHSSLRAATDVELEITKSEAGGCIRVTKARDEQEGAAYGFRLEPVELGTNAKGRIITTCVTVEADAPAGSGKKRKLGPNEQILHDVLINAIADQPDQPPPAPEIPAHARGARVERWRDAAMLRLPQAEAKQRNRAFDRAITSLVAGGQVHHLSGFAWLP